VHTEGIIPRTIEDPQNHTAVPLTDSAIGRVTATHSFLTKRTSRYFSYWPASAFLTKREYVPYNYG
jgi:hypothetical protein